LVNLEELTDTCLGDSFIAALKHVITR
jgi:hypothetical protein